MPDQPSDAPPDISLLDSARRLVRLVEDVRPMVAVALLIALAQALLLAPLAFLVRRVFEHSIPHRDTGEILEAAAAILLLYLVSSALALVSRRMAAARTKQAVGQVRARLLARLYALPPSWHDRNDPGVIHSVVIADGEHFDRLLTQLCHSVLPAILVALALSLVAIVLNPVLSAVVIVVIGATLLVTRGLARRSDRAAGRWHRLHTRFRAGIRVALRAMPLAKAHGAEAWELERRTAEATDLADVGEVYERARADYAAAVSGLVGIVGAVILVAGSLQVTSGDITLGELIAFYALGGLILRHAATATQTLANAHGGGESLLALERLLDAAEPEPYTGLQPHEPRGEVTLDGVTFGYGAEPTVANVDIELRAGEHVALLGPNGSGKSTLVRLILGLYEPTSGEVRIDGVSLADIDIGVFRRSIGVVMQDPVILPGTIADNISYGHPGATADEIQAAARAATAERFIVTLPQAYETEVGDEGLRLSGGERQRIAIARAMLGRPPLVILDEPTTYLDQDAIVELLERLDALPGTPTVLIVTHDPIVAAHTDRVVHLRDGRVDRIEAGTL